MGLKKKVIKRNYWKEEEERLLKGWADKSQCYQWMHLRAKQIYQRKNAWYTIPVIIISTLAGTANFAQERISDDLKPTVSMIIGSMSLIAGIITTISQFLKVSELNESHRIASLSWGKFYRDINAELIRHPLDRMSPDQFIKFCKEEYNRLVEISPFVPKKVLNHFNNKFKKNNTIIKPEICDDITSTDIYIMNNDDRNIMIEELNREVKLTNNLLEKKAQEKEQKKEKFRESFYTINRRYPNDKEIEKNLRLLDDDDDDNDDDIDDYIESDTEKSDTESKTDSNQDSNSTLLINKKINGDIPELNLDCIDIDMGSDNVFNSDNNNLEDDETIV